MGCVYSSFMINLFLKVEGISNTIKSDKKTITSLCCQDDPSHFWFRPPGFVVVVHHLAELCEAHNDREGDLPLQKALKLQLHHCRISLCGKIHFLLLKSPNYQNCHSNDQVAQ